MTLADEALRKSSAQFAEHLAFQEKIARLNFDAVDICMTVDHNDPETRGMAPEAIAWGIYSLRALLVPLTVHAIDLEIINARDGDLLRAAD